VGDTWRYRVQDQFRLGDLFLTAACDGVSAEGVAETWTTTSDAKLRTTVVPLSPGFTSLPGWTSTPPSSRLPARRGGTAARPVLPELSRRVEQAKVPLAARVEARRTWWSGQGAFAPVKLVLRGPDAAARRPAKAGAVSTSTWCGIRRRPSAA
jgi:hypothetical protein